MAFPLGHSGSGSTGMRRGWGAAKEEVRPCAAPGWLRCAAPRPRAARPRAVGSAGLRAAGGGWQGVGGAGGKQIGAAAGRGAAGARPRAAQLMRSVSGGEAGREGGGRGCLGARRRCWRSLRGPLPHGVAAARTGRQRGEGGGLARPMGRSNATQAKQKEGVCGWDSGVLRGPARAETLPGVGTGPEARRAWRMAAHGGRGRGFRGPAARAGAWAGRGRGPGRRRGGPCCLQSGSAVVGPDEGQRASAPGAQAGEQAGVDANGAA
jgi:hypothetical protein